MHILESLSVDTVRCHTHGDGRLLLSVDALELTAGLIYGIVGTNFSGRSALLRWIGGGLLPAFTSDSAGKVMIRRSSPARQDAFDPLQHATYVGPSPQDSLSGLTATVADELALHVSSGKLQDASSGLIYELLREFRLDSLAPSSPMQLSGGQSASVALICGYLMGRPVLCIDDSMSCMDSVIKCKAWSLCRRAAEYGAIVLVADNNFDLMAEHADAIVRMTDGHVSGVEDSITSFNRDDVRAAGTVPNATKMAQELNQTSPSLPIRYADLLSSLRNKSRFGHHD